MYSIYIYIGIQLSVCVYDCMTVRHESASVAKHTYIYLYMLRPIYTYIYIYHSENTFGNVYFDWNNELYISHNSCVDVLIYVVIEWCLVAVLTVTIQTRIYT